MTKPKATKPTPAASQDEAAFLVAQEQRIEQGIARGNYQTAHVAEAFARRTFAETPLGDVARAIKQAGDAVSSGDLSGLEHILTGQIVALNGVFVDCAMRAQGNMGQYLNAAESYMRLALKAQAQCARTAEVLGNLRAGPTIFAKQANVTTGPQQVNNSNFESTVRTRARTRKKRRSQQTNYWKTQPMSSSKGWSPERRQRQREAIQRWRPWEQSTGPRTLEGKAKAASNSLVHGLDTAQQREFMRGVRTFLRKQRQTLKEL